MAQDHSGVLVARWRAGDQQAAAELFQRYANQLIALARSRLSQKLARRVDAEDVVQSAYRSFFASAQKGRYDLQRGGDLWRLLVSITLNKLRHQQKRNRAAKRALQLEVPYGSEDSLLRIDPSLFARQPSPVTAVVLAEQLEGFMQRLPPLYRQILELRLQGRNLEEITAEIRRSERTVYRMLEEIKQQLLELHLDTLGS